MFALEDAKTDYIVHFDSDVLLYQAPDYDWITRSMELMDADPRVLFQRHCQARQQIISS